MSDPNTIRILVLSGGGERGHYQNEFMNAYCDRYSITKTEIWKEFDCIAGTSIGGINGAAYAKGYSPLDIRPFFEEKGKSLFTIRDLPVGCNANRYSNRPNIAQKIGLIGINDPFYKSPCGADSNFGDKILQDALIEKFGNATIQELLTTVLIPAVAENSRQFVHFSNYNNTTFYQGQNELIRNVLRATSAAPLYLPSFTFNGQVYIDGGVFENNPAASAIALMKMKKKNSTRICIMIIGTGRGQYTFDGTPDPTSEEQTLAVKLSTLFNQASDGQSEAVKRDIIIQSSSYSLEKTYSFISDPLLDPTLNTELDNTDPSFLTYLKNLAISEVTNRGAELDAFRLRFTA